MPTSKWSDGRMTVEISGGDGAIVTAVSAAGTSFAMEETSGQWSPRPQHHTLDTYGARTPTWTTSCFVSTTPPRVGEMSVGYGRPG
jgi:hypothetical protein